MEILTGGRQSGQKIYNVLKLYNYIVSLPNDTIVRVLKKDGMLALCVDKSISIQKVKEKIEKLDKKVKDYQCVENRINLYQRKVLQELLKESEK